MNISLRLKQSLYQTICLLYVLLFVYAAVSKVIDYENFGIQLGQSPLLSAYAGWLMWLVPALELLLSVVLIIDKFSTPALILSTGLMISFCVYIVILLNWTPFVPCSCGGILEKLGWKEHLYFNLAFVVLGFIGIFMEFRIRLEAGNKYYTNLRFVTLSAALSTISTLLVFYLYKSSDYALHNDNSFIRTFTEQPLEISKTDLKLDSYYFAGEEYGRIYLGNYTAPLAVEIMDFDGGNRVSKTITSRSYPANLRKAQLRILGNRFYLIAANDGVVYSGDTLAWEIKHKVHLEFSLLKYALIDSSTIAATYLSPKKGESILGKFSLASGGIVADNPDFLKRQVDGVFDVDGSMAFDRESSKLVYSYYYRNNYMLVGTNLTQEVQGKTIDTNSRAKIQIVSLKARGEKKLATPPVSVNKSIATSRNLLFIQSELPGQREPLDMWDVARVIDVYNTENKSYISSFYIYNIGNEKLKSFFVIDRDFYAFIGNYLVRYELGNFIVSAYH